MAKSLRSKRKRMFRRQRREKYKVKERERLLETLGLTKSDKDAEMSATGDNIEDCKAETTDQKQHVEQQTTEITGSNDDVEMEKDAGQKKSGKIRVDRKQLLKRLGKKKHRKKKNKICKW